MHHSMTAFARANEQNNALSLTIEMRSVNNRYLDISPRIPEIFRHLEADIRDKVKQRFTRGKIDIWISYDLLTSEISASLNEAALSSWITQLNQAGAPHSLAVPDWQDLLDLPGVIDNANPINDDNDKWFLTVFDKALDAMSAHRAREGEEIVKVLLARLNDIEQLVAGLKTHVPLVNQALTQQLRDKLAELDIQVDQQRFEQELVFLLSKADVGEELDRLNFHIKEARHALSKEGAIGRRLDFLMQEFNREANTLGAKAADNTLSQASVELKVLIEQMREQVQNLA